MPAAESIQRYDRPAARRFPAARSAAPPRWLATPDESTLVRRAQAGDAAARERLVTGNRGLIYSVARRYSCRSLTLEDLLQEGTIGFLAAVDRFDPSLGVRLSSFAVPCMHHAIQHAIDASDRVIRLPSKAGASLRELQEVREQLRDRLERDPDPEELAEACSLSPDRVRELLAAVEPVSLDAPLDDETETRLGDLLPDETAADPEAATLAGACSGEIQALLDTLPPPWRELLELRCGFRAGFPLSLAEAARRMGISGQRARSIEQAALCRLRRDHRKSPRPLSFATH